MSKLNVEDIRQLLEFPVLRSIKLDYEFRIEPKTLLTLFYAIELAQYYRVSLIGTNNKATNILNRELKKMITKLNDKFLASIRIDNIVISEVEEDYDILLKDYTFLALLHKPKV